MKAELGMEKERGGGSEASEENFWITWPKTQLGKRQN